MAAQLDTLAKPSVPAFASHPDRAAALAEAHARPSLPLHVPATLHHVAFACPTAAASDALFAAVLGSTPGIKRHTILVRGPLTLKLEPHTEFVSLTIVSSDGRAPGEALLVDVARQLPAEASLLVSLRVSVVDRATDEVSRYDIGGILRGGIEISTSLRAGDDGFVEFRIAAPALGQELLGRRVQRVLEAETYRTMTLLGLPVARRVAPELAEIETELGAVTALLTDGEVSDEDVLERLQHLSARTEAMRAATRYRFAASRAYAALVAERLKALAEEKVGDRTTLSEFTQTRLNPAVRTILSTEEREAELSAALGRALDLLRTRVDVSMNRGNQEILRSMNERQHRQLVMSEAVESLSVIAISYYLLGILSYPVKGLKELALLPVSETVALALLAPFVALAVYTALQRVRRRWDK